MFSYKTGILLILCLVFCGIQLFVSYIIVLRPNDKILEMMTIGILNSHDNKTIIAHSICSLPCTGSRFMTLLPKPSFTRVDFANLHTFSTAITNCTLIFN